MTTPLGGARSSAAALALLAVGCLSTDAPLFRDSIARGGATPVQAAPPPMLPLTVPGPAAPQAAMPAAQAPEQLLGAERDDMTSEPPSAAAGGAPAAAEPAPLPDPPLPDPPVPDPPPAAPVVPTDPCSFGDSLLCDSFEDELAGAFPRAARWLPELPGCASHVVDAAGPAFFGLQALRADAGGYPECMLHASLAAEEDVYVRTRVFLDGTGSLFTQYVTLLEFGTHPNRDDPELRIGMRAADDSVCPGVPGLDVSVSGLLGGSETKCTGFALEPDRWYCVEAHFARVGSDLSLNVAVDGSERVASAFAGAEAWVSPELFVKLGRASYGANGLGSIWHDDVAISREPIPCGP